MQVRTGMTAVCMAAMLAAPARAQGGAAECAAYAGNQQVENVCSAAVDGTRAFHPVAGLLLSGGNPVLGTASTLGGFGHLTLTVRANGSRVVLPDLAYNGGSTTVPAGDKVFAPVPLVEASAGLFRGLGHGFLALDVLGSAQPLPTSLIDKLAVDPNATRIGSVALGFGVGGRIGVLRESAVLPGVSVSVMRRTLPRITYGSLAGGDNFTYGIDLQAWNVRAAVSKKVAILALAAGLGWDRYTGGATIAFRNPVTSLPEPPIDFAVANERWQLFGNAGLDFGPAKLLGEIGYQAGKDQKLTTSFQDFDTTKGRVFGGVGLRFGF